MRRYSANDLTVVRRVAALAGEGINLAGIRRILPLEAELAALRTEIDAPRARERRRARAPPDRRDRHADAPAVTFKARGRASRCS
jgi:DNA-binding transcriptional MerR regulator